MTTEEILNMQQKALDDFGEYLRTHIKEFQECLDFFRSFPPWLTKKK